MSAIRDKSVVKSSVMPSAKYCCLGSSLRLANGNTTIDSRGAGRVSPDPDERKCHPASPAAAKSRAPTMPAMIRCREQRSLRDGDLFGESEAEKSIDGGYLRVGGSRYRAGYRDSGVESRHR